MQAGIQCMVQVRVTGPCKVVGRRLEFWWKLMVVPRLCMVAVLHLDCQWRTVGPAETSLGLPAAPPMANLPSKALRMMIRPAVKQQYCSVHSKRLEAFRRLRRPPRRRLGAASPIARLPDSIAAV